MKDASHRLRQLPRVDDLLTHPRLAALLETAPRALARLAARQAVEEARAHLLAEDRDADVNLSLEVVAARATDILTRKAARGIRRAVNAAGIILHTGLGRAPLSQTTQEALAEITEGYCNVQADLETGQRSPREAHIQWLFQEIVGAEAALVVNNNAAATVLVLNSLAAGREVIVSRGEMVEIGGAFRIPEIMTLAGCRLVEVGCTNRTHLRDYEKAINAETALILSVHQSNYRIVGFTAQAPLAELAKLAQGRGLHCAHDLGSGALLDLQKYGLPHEPTVPESLAAEADVVLFSGDKLLGGPQSGIILGKKKILDAMRKNPFYRTFRVDKLTLAALESTLRLFLEPETLLEKHRLMALLTCPLEKLRQRAEALALKLKESCGSWLKVDTQESESEIGGGSLAGYAVPTVVVRVQSDRLSPDEFLKRLRLAEPPVFARIHEDAVLLDMRTVFAEEDEMLLAALREIGKTPAIAGMDSAESAL